MFVKQINLKMALELAARGNEVLVLVPGADGDWANMQAGTLQKMLDGVLFFRREPAMKLPLVEAEQSPPHEKEEGNLDGYRKIDRLKERRMEHEKDCRGAEGQRGNRV